MISPKQLPFTQRALRICFTLASLVAGNAIAANDPQQSTSKEEAPAAAGTEQITQGVVAVKVTGVEKQLLTNVLGYLEIHQFNKKSVPSTARLRYLHRAAEKQILQALRPFGFYHASVTGELSQTSNAWKAHYQITLGEPVIIDSVDIKITGEAVEDVEFQKAVANAKTKLKKGQRLDQAAYEVLKKRLQVLASQRGFFDVKLEKHQIRVDIDQNIASITLHYETGKRYHLGKVNFQQETEWLWDNLLNRYVQIEAGQPYDARDLQQLQGDLSNSEYYAEVEIGAAPKSAIEHVIPVQVKLKPRKPRKYIIGIGYGTDTGVRGKVGITGRRVNRRGHKYSAEVLVSEIRYGIAGEYIIPGKDPRNDAWGIRSSYEEEHSDTRDYKAFNIGGYFRYRDGYWIKTYATDYRIEEFELGADNPTSSLLIPSIDWSRTFPAELEKRIYASHGTWLQLRLRGGVESLLSDTSFIQPMISAKWIYSFTNKGRIISRGTVGTTIVDDFSKLPTTLRFFSGGDSTVRGYKYSIIGPQNPDGDILGGKRLTEASLEYEFPIKEKWSLAAFIDAGDAFDDTPEYKAGVGLGLHWQSPIGPVRIDFGHGLEQPLGTDIRLHLTIGPDL